MKIQTAYRSHTHTHTPLLEYEPLALVGVARASRPFEGNAVALTTDCSVTWRLSVPKNEHFNRKPLAEITAEIRKTRFTKNLLLEK